MGGPEEPGCQIRFAGTCLLPNLVLWARQARTAPFRLLVPVVSPKTVTTDHQQTLPGAIRSHAGRRLSRRATDQFKIQNDDPLIQGI